MIWVVPVMAAAAVIGAIAIVLGIVLARASRAVALDCASIGLSMISPWSLLAGGVMVFASWWFFAALLALLVPLRP